MLLFLTIKHYFNLNLIKKLNKFLLNNIAFLEVKSNNLYFYSIIFNLYLFSFLLNFLVKIKFLSNLHIAMYKKIFILKSYHLI